MGESVNSVIAKRIGVGGSDSTKQPVEHTDFDITQALLVSLTDYGVASLLAMTGGAKILSTEILDSPSRRV